MKSVRAHTRFGIHRSPYLEVGPLGEWMHSWKGMWVSVAIGLAVLGAMGGVKANASELSEADSVERSLKGEQFRLKLHHLHTGESINVVYRIGNTYLPAAMAKLNYFLRDHRTNDEGAYDPKEFDLLHNILAKLKRPGSEIDIVCGYRTPESNTYLRTRAANTGVAQNSQHIQSKAIDIRIPGVRTAKLRDTALALGLGGVGYYPISQFVHVDVGPVRRWSYFGSGD